MHGSVLYDSPAFPFPMEFIFDSAVTGLVDAVVILVFTRLLSGIRLRFKDSLWVSFISLMASLVASFAIGFVFKSYPLLTLILSILVAWFTLVMVLWVMVGTSAYKAKISWKKAGLISLIAVVAQFFVASPIAYWLGPKILGS